MAGNTPRRGGLTDIQTNERLEKCWEAEINWELYPSALKEVMHNVSNLQIGQSCIM